RGSSDMRTVAGRDRPAISGEPAARRDCAETESAGAVSVRAESAEERTEIRMSDAPGGVNGRGTGRSQPRTVEAGSASTTLLGTRTVEHASECSSGAPGGNSIRGGDPRRTFHALPAPR